jgi:hypothetical protein
MRECNSVITSQRRELSSHLREESEKKRELMREDQRLKLAQN